MQGKELGSAKKQAEQGIVGQGKGKVNGEARQ